MSRLSTPGFLASALLFVSASLSAVPVNVQVSRVDSKETAGEEISVRFSLQESNGGSASAVRARVKASGRSAVELPVEGVWRVETESADLWSEPQWISVKAREEARPVELRLFPAGALQGKIHVPPETKVPTTLQVKLTATPGSKANPRPPASTISCPVEAASFRCTVPVGTLDLRIHGQGFVPSYRWGIGVQAGQAAAVGTLQLQEGASIVGWLRTDDPKAQVAKTRVHIVPRALGTPTDRETLKSLSAPLREAQANERGFFQLAPVPPGTYSLTAAQPGLAPGQLSPIEVHAGLESEIRQPIVLSRPVALEVVVDPAHDPYGEPFKVQIEPRSAGKDSNTTGIVLKGQAAGEGTWRWSNLAPGLYILFVLGDAGSQWAMQDVEVRAGQPPVRIEIPVLDVRGRVTLGDDPLAATVVFGGRTGLRKISLESDKKGAYSGTLPSAGMWKIDLIAEAEQLRLVLDPRDVHPAPGKSYAQVDIQVPNTRLRGDVVDEDDHPLPGAAVHFRVETGEAASLKTDENGKFEARGMKAGAILAEARSGERTSGWVNAQIAERGESPHLKLVAQGRITVHGRVVSSATGPVPGALIRAWPDLDRTTFVTMAREVSGSNGEFSVSLPATARSLNVLVFPPGNAFKMFKVPIDPKNLLTIAVEPAGGTLVVAFAGRTPDDVVAARSAVLAHGGTFVPLQALAEWAQEQRADQPGGNRMAVPNVEAGDYLLCNGAAGHQALRKGQAPPAENCTSGSLPPLATLELQLPGADQGAGR